MKFLSGVLITQKRITNRPYTLRHLTSVSHRERCLNFFELQGFHDVMKDFRDYVRN